MARLAYSGLFASIVSLGLVWVASPKPAVADETPTVDFNRDVRPILAKSCWTCHGPDPEPLKRTGNMKLDSFAGATEDRGGYQAIVPGNPEKSVLLKRVRADGASIMPPESSGLKPLTAKNIEILRTWISEGAEYKAHWAYVPPKPKPPALVKSTWARNEIDLYLESAMREKGLQPEPEADRPTLIRRLSFTLTGLPPTPEEVDRFVKDKSKNAYEKVVDRYLASRHYGEHQARYWLDAVRYADTHGLHIDNERAVYPYRDWVVRAFNEDLPYNDFATWQLAGDLLPNPTLDQKIATGYIRMNPTTNEGGVIEAEFLAKNTMDRVDTTSTIFLGATLGCAKCHDHKYDPYTQKDYYSLYAFFNSTADAPLDGNAKLHPPVMKAPSPEQQAEKDKLDSAISKIEAATIQKQAKAWAVAAKTNLPIVGGWQMAGPYTAADFNAAFATAFDPEKPDFASWSPSNFEVGKAAAQIIGKENAALYLRTTLTVAEKTEALLKVGSDDGIRIWLNGKLIHDMKVARALTPGQDSVKAPLEPGANVLLVKVVNAAGQDGLSLSVGDARSERILKAKSLAALDLPTPEQTLELRRIFLTEGPSTGSSSEYRKLVGLRVQLDAAIPFTYIAEELPKPRPAFILKRGEYNLPQAEVTRAVPAVLGSLPESFPKNRLGLAMWLTDAQNPLTARVFVNRIWQQHWGEGIVATSEDFGSRGEWPTHPALLDYLSNAFVEGGWSMKKLHRLIVTSAAFRQSAAASETKRKADPNNKLYARGPRFRLDAEVIRDSALSISGLLVDRPGGHGDKPYQPSGLWEAIAYPISDTARYVQDKGDALYRRSLYLFWKRTSPPPAMMLFDAPMRESCVVRRSRTNTPTQALATLNETGFFEAARVMAERVYLSGKSDEARLDRAFRLAVSRSPNDEERAVMLDLISSERKSYVAHEVEAIRALSVGESPRNEKLNPVEVAAWAIVCNAILNLDETVTQH